MEGAEERRFYRLLFENSLGLMCIHDLDGVLLAINPAAAESLGYQMDEGPGRSLRDFLAPAAKPRFDDYLQRIKSKGSDTGLMRLLASDGTERIWMYRNTIYDQAESEPRVLGHALDITERVRAEQSLKEARSALQEANEQLAGRVKSRTAELQAANEQLRAEMERRKLMEGQLLQARKLESLGVLAGGIAHDFNNFLTVIQGNVELARMQLAPSGPVCEALDETLGACKRAAQLSSQLLIFARGGAPVRRAESLSDLVSEAVQLARASAPVKFDVRIAADLQCAEVDAGQIGQVLDNILLNAKQASPGGGLIEVRADNVETEGMVRISVRDNGCGIPAEALPRIFDPYFTTKAAGVGLGLATAYAIVGKHGGRLSASSDPANGTVFTIDLPACAGDPATSNPHPPTARAGSGRLLAMDDEASLRQLLDRTLTALGYEVSCAHDGAEAVALYQAAIASPARFDAVLLDLTVADGMGGLEAAARLRELDPGVKLIVSSGYADAAVMADYRSYGFSGVIPKPWTAAALAEVFERVLSGPAG